MITFVIVLLSALGISIAIVTYYSNINVVRLSRKLCSAIHTIKTSLTAYVARKDRNVASDTSSSSLMSLHKDKYTSVQHTSPTYQTAVSEIGISRQFLFNRTAPVTP